MHITLLKNDLSKTNGRCRTKKRVVIHKSLVRSGPFGGTLTTTLCGRMQTTQDGMNIGDTVTCKFCLKEMARRGQ